MLKTLKISNQCFDVKVEIDDYVPLSVFTYDKPLGAMFYRLGNFDTSLIEIAVDPESGALRGFTVVSVDQRFEGQASAARLETGVPIADLSAFAHHDILDDPEPFSLGLQGNNALVTMRDFENSDTIAVCGDLKFYLHLGTLVGLAVENLSRRSVMIISDHLSRI
ncbi:MAG: hypothetical protein AAFY19_02375 [Pseudomonadota bacterium]